MKIQRESADSQNLDASLSQEHSQNVVGQEILNLSARADWSKGFLCDGHMLLPAIVQSASSAEVLMLGYVCRESLALAASTQKVVFYSRSQKKLWVKGETSGHFFLIRGAGLDCDSDTFLFSVIPHGAACHRQVRTCFSRDDNSDVPLLLSSASVISRVFETITLRSQGRDPSSYSFKMLEGAFDRLLKKIGEEATETVLAAKNLEFKKMTLKTRSDNDNDTQTQIEESVGLNPPANLMSEKQEFLGEAADLLFHLLLVCSKLQVEPSEIMEVLEKRQGAIRRDGTVALE